MIWYFILGLFLIVLWVIISSKNDGENRNRYLHNNEWRTLRDKVLSRDDYRCSSCKRYFYKNKSKLHVHHIIERSQWGEDSLENLISLCEICHVKEHKDSVKPIHSSVKRKIIERAITDSAFLCIDYRSQSLWGIWNNTTRKIKPDKFYSENWHYYVSGFCFLTNEYRHFRVSRIIKFHEKNDEPLNN